MTRTPDTLTTHQLLGRIVYFHALFIEPALRASPSPWPGPACCNHSAAAGCPTVDTLLPQSAWAALIEVATAIPAHNRQCPKAAGSCCATCRIASSAAAVAAGWAQTEFRSYQMTSHVERRSRACARTAAARLARVFATQHAVQCLTLQQLTEAAAEPEGLPDVEELPLTGELLALWADPTATTGHPVTSWLNHCTGLDDVRRVLRTRRNGS